MTPDEIRSASRNVLGRARYQFWGCPVPGHSDRRGDNGWPVVTVEWDGGVARCTAPGCGRTSAHPDPGDERHPDGWTVAEIVEVADVIRAYLRDEAPDVARLLFNADVEEIAMRVWPVIARQAAADLARVTAERDALRAQVADVHPEVTR